MRKVVLSMLVSIDGYIDGPNHDLNWFCVGREEWKYFNETLDNLGTILYGRVSFESLADYWQAAEHDTSTSEIDRDFARKMNRAPKIVFSRTLREAGWNARVVSDDVATEVDRLKREPGGDLVLFAGAALASSFTKLGLIDEYRLLINPVVLGSGTPLFQDLPHRLDLKLIQANVSAAGVIHAHYQAR